MRCPYCRDDHDKVIDSRSTDGGRAIRRRRECATCGRRFTTYETIEQGPRPTVIKRDGSRVPFDRHKVLTGLQRAAYKRPVSAEALETIVEEVEEALIARGDVEVESIEIGRRVAQRLRRLDGVAYVRFASVYMRLDTLDELMEQAREAQAAEPILEAREQPPLFRGEDDEA